MKKILVIEDSKEIRENTAEILTMANYKVFTAKNGKEGVALAQKEKPDIIICDILMPVLDGYGVLHLLSKNPDTASIPFIFLTAKIERSAMRKGMEMGADDYLTKPFDDAELLNAIESRFRKSEVLIKEFQKNYEGLNEFINGIRTLDQLKRVCEEHEVKTVKKKESVYREGSYPRGIYFVVNGKIKSNKTNDFGKDLITGIYNEGDFFGYLALFEENKYGDSAIALEDSEVCLIPKTDFEALVYKNADVSRKFIKMLSNNLHQNEEQLLKLAYDSVRKRIADAIITLHNQSKKEGDKIFRINITRENLANLAGTASETVTRTLYDFENEKLILVDKKNITILNPDKLAKLKN